MKVAAIRELLAEKPDDEEVGELIMDYVIPDGSKPTDKTDMTIAQLQRFTESCIDSALARASRNLDTIKKEGGSNEKYYIG